jgi:hypothetical protein
MSEDIYYLNAQKIFKIYLMELNHFQSKTKNLIHLL